MWFSFVPLLFSENFRIIGILFFVIVLLYKWWIQGRCLSQLKEKGFVRYFLFWDLFYALLMPVLYYISERQKYYKW
jgi:hypothetical protein